MVLLITTSSHLDTPMYFFLCMLFFIDACYSSVIAPKLFADLVSNKKTISYSGCAASLYFFCSLVTQNLSSWLPWLMTGILAICKPLLYIVMSKRICCQLAIDAFLGGTMSSVIHTTNTFHLSFCSKEINHFFL